VSASVTQAVLLVGGEGRRLRPLTDTRPKPMMTLVDRPFVTHQLDHLRRHGIHDVIFSCGYRPEALEAHFGDGSAFDMRLAYVVDPEPLGTAGAVKNAESLLTGDRVLVFNGDILTDLDLDALAAQHLERGSAGTIALTPVEEPWAYGLVRLHPNREVEAFLEKPTPDELRPGEPFLINAGTYLLEREVVERMPAGRKCSIEREVFPDEAARMGLYGFPSECYWRDIGTPTSYRHAHLDVLSGAVRTESPTGTCYLGPGATVAEDADVGPLASLGAGAVVEPGARVERSVIGDGARIERGAAVADAIVGAGATIGEGAVLADGVVVGDDAVIGAGNRLRGPLKVATGARIAAFTLLD
jgi:mannose-1-phosphate guanylyltransferase